LKRGQFLNLAWKRPTWQPWFKGTTESSSVNLTTNFLRTHSTKPLCPVISVWLRSCGFFAA